MSGTKQEFIDTIAHHCVAQVGAWQAIIVTEQIKPYCG